MSVKPTLLMIAAVSVVMLVATSGAIAVCDPNTGEGCTISLKRSNTDSDFRCVSTDYRGKRVIVCVKRTAGALDNLPLYRSRPFWNEKEPAWWR